MKKSFTLTSLIFFVFATHAQKANTLIYYNNVILTIIPHICVAPRGENSCISTIDISWKSSIKGSFCLKSDVSKNNLQCWQSKNSGIYQHKLIFDKNITYQINDELTKKALANATMKFKSLKPHRKYKKRRNRFPWSLGTP